MKKLLTTLTALVTVSCQPAVASEEKYIINAPIPLCTDVAFLNGLEHNYKQGLSMSNIYYFENGLCALLMHPTEVKIDKWPVNGSFQKLVNVRIDGEVYVTRKFYLEQHLEVITE